MMDESLPEPALQVEMQACAPSAISWKFGYLGHILSNVECIVQLASQPLGVQEHVVLTLDLFQ